jgi:hypothetical protein
MKFLFIGFNRIYMNPSTNAILECFAIIGNLHFFGPGYSSAEELKKGPQAKFDSDSYDFVITDSMVLEWQSISARVRPFSTAVVQFDLDMYVSMGKVLAIFFDGLNAKKLAIANIDTYCAGKELMDRLTRTKAFIVEPGASTARSKEFVTIAYGEEFPAGNDNWFEFSNTYKHLFLSIPHTIAYDEFDFTPVADRPENFSVVGATYRERKRVLPLTSTTSRARTLLRRVEGYWASKTRVTMTERQMYKLRSSYVKDIKRAKFVYCSGGPYMLPVRKYFEIPALGSIPVGQVCSGFSELGFEDGENYFVSNSPDEVRDVVYSQHGDDLQEIVSNSRNMIMQNHSVPSRSKQLKTSLELIASGAFKGSYWHEGKYLNYE